MSKGLKKWDENLPTKKEIEESGKKFEQIANDMHRRQKSERETDSQATFIIIILVLIVFLYNYFFN